MKKILVLLCIFGCAVMGSAQSFKIYTPAWEKSGPYSQKIERFLTRLFTPAPEKPKWVKAVENQVHKATPHQGIIGGIITDYILPQQDGAVPQVARARVAAIKQKWQTALETSRLPLHHFTVKVPVAQDITSLTSREINEITDLLNGILIPGSDDVKEYRHYIVRVTLRGEKTVHILFNCYCKEMYVVRDLTHLRNIPLEEL